MIFIHLIFTEYVGSKQKMVGKSKIMELDSDLNKH